MEIGNILGWLFTICIGGLMAYSTVGIILWMLIGPFTGKGDGKGDGYWAGHDQGGGDAGGSA